MKKKILGLIIKPLAVSKNCYRFLLVLAFIFFSSIHNIISDTTFVFVHVLIKGIHCLRAFIVTVRYDFES